MDNVPMIIRMAREQAGLTRSQLSEKTGLAVGTIGQYERGARHPKGRQLQLLADALGIPANMLSPQYVSNYIPDKSELPMPGDDDYEDEDCECEDVEDNDYVGENTPSPIIQPDHRGQLPLGQNLGENIRIARQAAGMTQKQLANKIGVALITIQQYESERRRPRIQQLQRLAEVFEVSAYDLAPSPHIDWERALQSGLLTTDSKPVEKTRLQVEVAYLEKHHRNQWLSLMTQDGKENRYFCGKLNDVLYELTPEAVEVVITFAEFMKQREAEHFNKKSPSAEKE